MRNKTTEVVGVDVPEIISLGGDSFFATVEIIKTDGGYSTEWWVSGNFEEELLVVGSLCVPVWGETLEDASKKVVHLRGTVLDLILNVYDGSAKIHSTPEKNLKLEIARRHITHYVDSGSFISAKDRFVAAYSLAQQFRVKEVAQLIADILNMNVRTIHDWIYQARQRG
jgi:hypothetical protein